MINYIEYLKIPGVIASILVGAVLVLNIVGEICEVLGKSVPEIMKIRKYFKRRSEEKRSLREAPQTLADVKKTLEELNNHYSADNITKRDEWIKNVDSRLEQNEKLIKELSDNTLSLLIDNKRNTIIDFAAHVVNESAPVTREQFNRIFKIYKEYEEIIRKHKMTNGEVDIAIRIIKEAYEVHLRNSTFIENIRGYDS